MIVKTIESLFQIQGVEVNSGETLISKFGIKNNVCTETNDTSEESPNIQL